MEFFPIFSWETRKKIVFLTFFLLLSASHPAASGDLPWVEHSVEKGDSISFIAGRYGISIRSIMRANELNSENSSLEAGQRILVPKGDTEVLAALAEVRARKRGETTLGLSIPLSNPSSFSGKGPEQSRDAARESMILPLAGKVSSPFGKRRGRIHDGIDIPAPKGTPITAARSGRVVFSGIQRGYGRTVIIDHGMGLLTRYSHCSASLTKKGEWVKRGQAISKVGRTGRATCSHLHFSVIQNGRAVDPKQHLPR